MSKRCNFEHTNHQPNDDEWKCPECGSKEISIDDSPNFECGLIHPDDYVLCEDCLTEFSGQEIAEKLGGKTVKCPHCKGTGWVTE